MGKDVGGNVQTWAVVIFGIFVLALLGVALIPLITAQFSDTGAFRNATCTSENTTTPGYPTDNTTAYNCISNNYSAAYSAVPVILIIVFVVTLILGVLGLLKMGKHR